MVHRKLGDAEAVIGGEGEDAKAAAENVLTEVVGTTSFPIAASAPISANDTWPSYAGAGACSSRTSSEAPSAPPRSPSVPTTRAGSRSRTKRCSRISSLIRSR